MILQQGITIAKKKKPEKYKNIPDILPPFALRSEGETDLKMKSTRYKSAYVDTYGLSRIQIMLVSGARGR
jgi:hypothetical protein